MDVEGIFNLPLSQGNREAVEPPPLLAAVLRNGDLILRNEEIVLFF